MTILIGGSGYRTVWPYSPLSDVAVHECGELRYRNTPLIACRATLRIGYRHVTISDVDAAIPVSVLSTGGLGETHQLADVNLAADTFHRQFTTTIPATPETAALPDMRGSGAVRDLREAATQSAALQTLLTQYAAAPTRAAQMGLIDQMLDAWADSSGYAETLDDRAGARYIIRYDSFGNVTRSTHLVSGAAPAGGLTPDVDNTQLDTTYRNSADGKWLMRC